MMKQAILEQVERYFDGLYFNDLPLLSSVFHQKAQYCCTTGGELNHLLMPEYFELLKKRESPASKKQTRQDKVLSIDIIGKNTALVKVQCVIEPKYFTDFLSFVFIDGRWQIISKVFHFQHHSFFNNKEK